MPLFNALDPHYNAVASCTPRAPACSFCFSPTTPQHVASFYWIAGDRARRRDRSRRPEELWFRWDLQRHGEAHDGVCMC